VSLRGVGIVVYLSYLVGVVIFGSSFFKRSRTTEGFMAARRWYFDAGDAQRHARWQPWAALPEQRQTLQPKVEATVQKMWGQCAMAN